MRKHWSKHSRKHGGAKNETIIEGVIQHHGRFAFLLSEKEGGMDAFLHGRGLNLAMDGDRVSALVSREPTGRFAGKILKVIKHANSSIVGILKKTTPGWAICPEKGNAPSAQIIDFAHKIIPKEGAFAIMKVNSWPTESQGATGTVIEVIGDPCDMRARITSLLRVRGIYEDFPKEVLAISDALPDKIEPPAWHGREQLFHLPIVTIDGADAKDFDDAVSIESLGGGLTRLGVHIADVAHFVRHGSALDKEAYKRGTSVYLPDRVVPMLPPALSNNLCSLVPDEERLTVSVFMDINSEGKVIRRRLANTVIRSCRRFTYEEVEAILEGKKAHSVSGAVHEAVMRMGELARVLHRCRVKRGALDFELPEYKVKTDAHGKPTDVMLRPRLESHRLIEEFMLLANEAIATELMAAKAPFLHRRHDEPDPLKIKTLAKTLGDMGLSAGHLVGGNTHKALQDIMRQAENHPLEDIINSLIVRSMQKAVYSPESRGHFGIAARAYAHFTSPIRRYPDLMAHRAIKALIGGKKENPGAVSLAEAGVNCSERERVAQEAEYKAVDIMRAELFKSRIGAVMEGTVTSVIDSGSFVMCGDTGAEGMLRVTNLKPGEKIKVIIEAVDSIEGKISLSLAQQPQIPTHWRVTPGKNPKRRKR